MRHTAGAVVAIASVLTSAVAAGQIIQPVAAGRAPPAVLTDAQARRILSESTKILQTQDFPTDTACAVTFSLSPNLVTAESVPSVINSAADFNAVCAHHGFAHAVVALNWCKTQILGGATGCSQTPGPCMLVIRLAEYASTAAGDIEGILWAHEFGHTRGLPHRKSEMAVMNPYLGPTERGITKAECEAYKIQALGTAQTATTRIVASPPPPTATAAPGDQYRQAPPIQVFVKRLYAEGIPLDEASRYSAHDAKELMSMLRDPAQAPYSANITTVLGLIGDASAADALMTFSEKNGGVISDSAVRGKLSAISALGLIVNRLHNRAALLYLIRGLMPSRWASVQWAGPGPAEERNRDLARAAARGLGFAGTPEAAQALQRAREDSSLESLWPVVDDALKINRRIQAQGLDNYLREKR
jgi:hypothetical protein